MSTGFNWFKSYKITIHRATKMWDWDEHKLEYIGEEVVLIQEQTLPMFKTSLKNIVERESLQLKRIL